MKRPLLFFCALAACAQQVHYQEVAADARGGWVTPPFPALALAATWRGDAGFTLRVRTVEGWKTLARDPDAEPGSRHWSHLLYLGFTSAPVEYEAAAGSAAGLEFVFIDPGATSAEQQQAVMRRRGVPPREAAAPPPIVSRAEWGARAPTSAPSPTVVTHLIVHHSADSPPAPADFAAWVRAIQIFHQNSNGWADIGYNFLAAPDGALFEGRGDGILGAHFSGVNTGTMGVSVLGTYSSVEPPAPALRALNYLLAWQAGRWKIDPAARLYHASSQLDLAAISGHRDANRSPRASGSTECPGNAFYAMLPGIRTQVAALLGPSGPLLSSGADSGLDGWTATGLWSASPARSVSPGASWYYGHRDTRTYRTGNEPNSGTFSSPEFRLDRDAVLSFYSWYDTENDSTLWDEKSVEISVDAGPWRRISQISGLRHEWMPFRIPLRDRGLLRIRFRFDTVDGALNDFEGWYVDDILVAPEP